MLWSAFSFSSLKVFWQHLSLWFWKIVLAAIWVTQCPCEIANIRVFSGSIPYITLYSFSVSFGRLLSQHYSLSLLLFTCGKSFFHMLLYNMRCNCMCVKMFLGFSLQKTFFWNFVIKWLALEGRNTEQGRRMRKKPEVVFLYHVGFQLCSVILHC